MVEMDTSQGQSRDNAANILLLVIISIFCINLLLIYKVIAEARRKTRGSNRAKHLVLIFQALGDISLGVFPLGTLLHSLLDNAPIEDSVCWHRILAHTYLFHFIPFVHATGIIVLTRESFVFWWRQGLEPPSQLNGVWCSRQSLTAGLFPWLLGALTVAPLVLLGFDFDECDLSNYSLQRIESFYWLSIILPGIVAFIAACAYWLSSLPRASQISKTSLASHPRISTCQFENDSPTDNETVLSGLDNMKRNLNNIDYNGHKLSKQASDLSNAKPHYGDHRKGCQEFVNLLADFNLDEKDVLIRKDEYETSYTLTQAEEVLMKIVWEKRSRAAAAILFLVCSMPRAVMDLMSFAGDSVIIPSESALISVVEFLYRLHVLRSLLSPLVWLKEYS